ncbi:hypothetical protein SLA2020_394250 [Shorea laevis]
MIYLCFWTHDAVIFGRSKAWLSSPEQQKANEFMTDNIKSVCNPASQVVALAGMCGSILLVLVCIKSGKLVLETRHFTFSKGDLLDFDML